MPRMAEKIPGWVEGLLIPTLESKVRSIVSEEVGHLEKVLDARFDGIHSEIRRVDEKVDSLERVPNSSGDGGGQGEAQPSRK